MTRNRHDARLSRRRRARAPARRVVEIGSSSADSLRSVRRREARPARAGDVHERFGALRRRSSSILQGRAGRRARRARRGRLSISDGWRSSTAAASPVTTACARSRQTSARQDFTRLRVDVQSSRAQAIRAHSQTRAPASSRARRRGRADRTRGGGSSRRTSRGRGARLRTFARPLALDVSVARSGVRHERLEQMVRRVGDLLDRARRRLPRSPSTASSKPLAFFATASARPPRAPQGRSPAARSCRACRCFGTCTASSGRCSFGCCSQEWCSPALRRAARSNGSRRSCRRRSASRCACGSSTSAGDRVDFEVGYRYGGADRFVGYADGNRVSWLTACFVREFYGNSAGLRRLAPGGGG